MNINHLKVREIEASMVSSLVQGFAREIGYEKAMEITRKVIEEDALRSGKRSWRKNIQKIRWLNCLE